MKVAVIYFLLFGATIMLAACTHELPSPATAEKDSGSDELSLADFSDPETCAGCHPNHYDEWEGSMHAYAVVDPVFNAMQELGQTETEGKLDQFCIQCHSPIASQLGYTPPFYREEELPDIGKRGVSCTVCHSISEVRQTANAEITLSPQTGMKGPIKDPQENPFHKSEFSELFLSSELCGGCHNVVNARGVIIENTFNEWKNSPAAAQGQQCQDCHMPAYRGQAAVGGPERIVHRHYFVGVDLALVEFPDREEQRQLVTELLRSAADISVELPDSIRSGGILPLTVHITSKTAGHHLPTGAVADRQMWLAVTVIDQATGMIIYQSGHLDANGDLMNRHSELNPNADFDLVLFNQLMVGENGQDVFFSWQAYSERTQTLPPLATVSPAYSIFVPPGIEGPLHIEVRLRFRSFPPFILRKLNLHDLARNIPIIDMDEWSGTVVIKSE